MGERNKRLPHDHEETIAAFDREREEAHELSRRHHEIVTAARRNDRVIGRTGDQRDH